MTDPRPHSRKWNIRYMELAKLVSGWSSHERWRIGAVAIGQYGQVLSTGYNGTPRGYIELPGVKEEDGPSATVHAEQNVVYNAGLTGTILNGSMVYLHGALPCADCAKALIQTHVCNIILPEWQFPGHVSEKWQKSAQLALALFQNVGTGFWLMKEDGEAVRKL